MAWSTPSSRTTGYLVTAAVWNSDVVDNPIALYGGALSIASQAALDFLYASSATQMARLAKGSGYQVPRLNSGASAYEFASLPRLVAQSVTEVGNVGTGEDDLISLTIPASTLATNGERLVGTFHGAFSSDNDTRTVKLKFGATTLVTITGDTGLNGAKWMIRFEIARTGATAQLAVAHAAFASSTGVSESTPAETLSGAITLKVTGEGVDTNDVRCKSGYAMWLPASA